MLRLNFRISINESSLVASGSLTFSSSLPTIAICFGFYSRMLDCNDVAGGIFLRCSSSFKGSSLEALVSDEE